MDQRAPIEPSTATPVGELPEPRGRAGARPWVFAGLALVAAGLIYTLSHGKPKETAAPKAQEAAVETAVVAQRDVPVTVQALGAAQAWRSAAIRAQVAGRLIAVPVTEGSQVRKGQLLAQLDPAPLAAALVQAQGALKRDEALLANAKREFARYTGLASLDSVARQQVDLASAQVKQFEGVTEIDRGSVAAAKANLGYTRLLAPFDGRVGVRGVDEGNLVSPTDATAVVTVSQVSPIAVVFSVPQGEFSRLAQASGDFRRSLAVVALSQETGAPLGQGVLTAADNRVDPSTGTVQLKGRFANDAHKLWPGQFVNVRLMLGKVEGAVAVPAAAVNHGPKGDFAFVVGADHKVKVAPLKVASTQEGVAVIAQGLVPGQAVVIDGQLGLKAGSKVRARPQAKP